jgi:hypothetical protein
MPRSLPARPSKPPMKPGGPITREHVVYAREMGFLVYRLLVEEKHRAQVQRLHKATFGEWQEQFDSLAQCRGRALLCLMGKTVLAYQSFDPYPSAGNPFPGERAMRFTFIATRQDKEVQARGAGLALEIIRRSLDLAWDWGYTIVYTYAEAYELVEACGFVPLGGRAVLFEAKMVRDMDPDQVPTILFYAARPKEK